MSKLKRNCYTKIYVYVWHEWDIDVVLCQRYVNRLCVNAIYLFGDPKDDYNP